MKIQSIEIQKILGAQDVFIAASAPVLVVAGDNYSGKSSTREAIYHALANVSTRTELKKDGAELVTKGAKKGLANIVFDGGSASILLPKGAHVFEYPDVSINDAEMMQMSMPYCLDGAKFCSDLSDNRRKFIMRLMRVKMTPKEISERLLKKGADNAKTIEITPFLKGGIAAAVLEAQEKARNLKADWKAITRETWGAEKAPLWEISYTIPSAVAALDVETIKREIAATESLITKLNSDSAELRVQIKNHGELEDKRKKLTATASTLQHAQDVHTNAVNQLTTLDAELSAMRERATGASAAKTLSCPCCAAVLELVGGQLIEHVPPNVIADPDAVAKLPALEMQRAALEETVETTKRALAKAAEAKAALAAMAEPQSIEAINQDVITLHAELEALNKNLAAFDQQLQSINDAKIAKQRAEDATKKAAAIHTDIANYLKIAGLLQPEGIPSDLLGEAIAPFNEALRASAEIAEWLVPSLDSDTSITYGGRAYHLCSESEKWRCDALIAATIAKESKLRMIMLDRFDCLNSVGRADMIAWLECITQQGDIDTAIVFGTMKDKPVLPDTCQLVWMNDGVSEDWLYNTSVIGGSPRWDLIERAQQESDIEQKAA